jgi:pimeloyl-ACP methyl ester carboxylesterase
VDQPDTRYAVTRDGVYLAYRQMGSGAVDLLVQFDWMGNVDTLIDTEPSTNALWRHVSEWARVVFFDRRGTGLSGRNVRPPALETAISDTRDVLAAARTEHPVLFGFLASGGTNAMPAATTPSLVRSLIWLNPVARSVSTSDYPWGVRPEYIERSEQAILDTWGTSEHGLAHNITEARAGAAAGTCRTRSTWSAISAGTPRRRTLRSRWRATGTTRTSEACCRRSGHRRSSSRTARTTTRPSTSPR